MIKPNYQNYSGTDIRPEKTQAEISRELNRYGITRIQHTFIDNGFSVGFQVDVEGVKKPIMVRIDIPYDQAKDSEDKLGWVDLRIKYRVLYWYIKALLTAWDNGLKAFMDIFLPHIVLPGGRTVSQDLIPKYTMAIESGQMEDIKLLPGAEK